MTVIFVDLVGFTVARRDARPRGRARHPRALPRPRPRRDRIVRRGGREVHRRCGGRRVRRTHRLRRRPRAAVRAALAVREAIASRRRRPSRAPTCGSPSIPARRWSPSAPGPSGERRWWRATSSTPPRACSPPPPRAVCWSAPRRTAARNGLVVLAVAEPVTGQGQGAAGRGVARASAWPAGTAGQAPTARRSRRASWPCCEGIWERAPTGRRRTWSPCSGPAGVGKTRLASEFTRIVAAMGGRAVRGRCLPYRE